jgi:hypothetical protein
MEICTIDASQRKAARVAGAAYLIAIAAAVIAQFRIQARLLVEHDAAATARNILAHERLFRVGIGLDLISCAATVVLLSALYVVLKPVHRNLALLAAFWRFLYALMWIQMTLNLFDALRILTGAEYLRGFDAASLQAAARLYLGMRFDQYYVALLFGALGSTVCGYLWLKSRYIPRTLAGFGLAASAWCTASTFIFIIDPHFAKVVNLWWFDTPMGIFDIALSFWLLFVRLGPNHLEPDTAT